MACITKRDAISHHSRPTQQARALECVLAEPVANPVDRVLQALRARVGRLHEEVELSGVAVAEAAQPDAEGADGAARVAGGE